MATRCAPPGPLRRPGWPGSSSAQPTVIPAPASTAAIHSAHSWSCGLYWMTTSGRSDDASWRTAAWCAAAAIPHRGGSVVHLVAGDPRDDPLIGRAAATLSDRAGRRRWRASPRRRTPGGTAPAPRPSTARAPRLTCPRAAPGTGIARDLQAGVDVGLLGVIDPHRNRQDRDVPLAVLLNLPGDPGRALHALGIQGKAVDHHVRQVQGADVRDIGGPVRLSIRT